MQLEVIDIIFAPFLFALSQDNSASFVLPELLIATTTSDFVGKKAVETFKDESAKKIQIKTHVFYSL